MSSLKRNVIASTTVLGMVLALLFVVAVASGALTPALYVSLKEYKTPRVVQPFGITTGPDGALWMTLDGGHIGRMTTTGAFTEYPVPGATFLYSITTGSDGAMWFAVSGGRIGRITTAGLITQFTLPPESEPWFIIAGPDGALWFTETSRTYPVWVTRIGRMTTAGVLTAEYPGFANVRGMTAGPDGAVWVTDLRFSDAGQPISAIMRIGTDGSVRKFRAPTGAARITAGSDSALWVTAYWPSIWRMTTEGVMTEYSVGGDSAPGDVTPGPDGALWFTELHYNCIGRISTSGVVSQYRLSPNRYPDKYPSAITTGSDGTLWFVEQFIGIGQAIPLWVTGDLNNDGRVDCTDAAIVRGGLGQRTGAPGFDARMDLNRDGIIDVRDLSMVLQQLPSHANCR